MLGTKLLLRTLGIGAPATLLAVFALFALLRVNQFLNLLNKFLIFFPLSFLKMLIYIYVCDVDGLLYKKIQIIGHCRGLIYIKELTTPCTYIIPVYIRFCKFCIFTRKNKILNLYILFNLMHFSDIIQKKYLNKIR